MYIVRFVRADEQPNEEYFYQQLRDAKIHLDSFRDDESNLYRLIEITDADDCSFVYEVVSFVPNALGRWARLRLDYLKSVMPEKYEQLQSLNRLEEHLISVEAKAQKTFDDYVFQFVKHDAERYGKCAVLLAEEQALYLHVYN